MQGFIASNPIYISTLKNDRNFTCVKQIHTDNSKINLFSVSNLNIYKIIIKSKFNNTDGSFDNLSIGDRFTLGKYQVESEDPWDLEWEIMQQSNDYQIAQTTTIIDIRNFDAMEPNNPNTQIAANGDNRWSMSNIKQFLNSDQATWYSAQHEYDQAPSDTYDGYGFNGYDTHKGFLYYFSDEEKSLLKDMTLTLANPTQYGGGSYTWTGKVWLPTYTQMGYGNNNSIAEGTKFDKYNDKTSRILYLHPQCAANNKYAIKQDWSTRPWYYWMCSAYIQTVYRPYNTAYDGALHNGDACWGDGGIAPCICLNRNNLYNEPICFTLTKSSNSGISEIGKIFIDNKNNIGTLYQDIVLNESDTLALNCSNSAVTADYDILLFYK